MEQKNKQEIKRGDVFFIKNDQLKLNFPHEQAGPRPAVVIQNDIGNFHSPTIIVAYITSQWKKEIPTHVITWKTPKSSVIMCEQIATVSKERLGRFCCHLSDADMTRVDRAIKVSLGLEGGIKNETF